MFGKLCGNVWAGCSVELSISVCLIILKMTYYMLFCNSFAGSISIAVAIFFFFLLLVQNLAKSPPD